MSFKNFTPGPLLNDAFEMFFVREISSGRLRIGGFTTGEPIPENTSEVLINVTFDILSQCKTDFEFISLKDNIIAWPENRISFGTISENGLADAIRLLRIITGDRDELDVPVCVPDIGSDGKMGLEEVIYLLQKYGEMRN